MNGQPIGPTCTHTDHVRTPQPYCGHLARSSVARPPNAMQRDRRRIRPAPRQTASQRASRPAIPEPSSAVPCGKQKNIRHRVHADAPIRLDSLASHSVKKPPKGQFSAPLFWGSTTSPKCHPECSDSGVEGSELSISQKRHIHLHSRDQPSLPIYHSRSFDSGPERPTLRMT